MTDKRFTNERCSAIIDAIAHHIPHDLAAEANGICYTEYYDWLETGRAHMLDGVETKYAKFYQDIKRAEMQAIRSHLDIMNARPEHWEAHAWILHHRWPQYFNQKETE